MNVTSYSFPIVTVCLSSLPRCDSFLSRAVFTHISSFEALARWPKEWKLVSKDNHWWKQRDPIQHLSSRGTDLWQTDRRTDGQTDRQTAPQVSKSRSSTAERDKNEYQQELSYRKQVARQLRTQNVEGTHRTKHYTVTLKSRLRVTQGHWKWTLDRSYTTYY